MAEITQAKNKIVNLFLRKKEKELMQTLRQEKKQADASNKIKDFIKYYLINKQEKAERIASEKIRDDLLAYGARLNYLRMLKGETPIQTKTGDTKTAKDILLKSILDKRERNFAMYKLEGRKRMEEIKNYVPQSLMVVAPIINRPMPEEEQPKVHPAVEKYKNLIPLEYLKNEQNFKFKNMYASVVQDAKNSALSRLVELDGKQYIAQQLAIESPNIKLRKSTLAQKLGLEERDKDNINLFSSANIRNENMDLAMVPYTGGYSKRGRLVKGSQEAKDHMAKLRAMRKPKVAKAPKSAGRPAKLPVFGPPNRRGRPAKYTPSAPAVVSVPAPIRDIAALIARANFRPRTKPRGRPRKNAKAFDSTVYSVPAPIRDVAALIARANFRPRTKPRGRPRKDAKVFY